jgi:hypothetical protein
MIPLRDFHGTLVIILARDQPFAHCVAFRDGRWRPQILTVPESELTALNARDPRLEMLARLGAAHPSATERRKRGWENPATRVAPEE